MAVKEDRKLNVFFLPYFTTSHLIPIVDTARLFAARGLHVTIATTPSNAVIFQASVAGDIASGSHIAVRTMKFPSSEVGLPEGIESFGAVSSLEMAGKFLRGVGLLRPQMEQLIRDCNPDCIVSDMFYPWTVDIASELRIPRILLYANNCLFHCAFHSLKVYAPHEKVQSDSETFVIPHLPVDIEMTRSELENHLKSKTDYGEFLNAVKESELRSLGIIFTSYSELEPEFVDHFKNVLGRKKCWFLGLPSHFIEKNKVGNKEQIITKQHSCLSWLDNQKPDSVLYVCFGSMILFPDTQLTEIALALEASGHPFVWAVRNGGKTKENEKENWMPEGFEERVKETNKGLIIREWTPQVSILNHPACGGFMTHCGWNSSLEGTTAGVPLLTWPLFAEQFYNEKLITQVLKIGIQVGSGVWNLWFKIKSPVVGKDRIVNAVTRMMGGSEEAQEIRRRAKDLGVMAQRSVEEGGPSYCDLNALTEEISKGRLCGKKKE